MRNENRFLKVLNLPPKNKSFSRKWTVWLLLFLLVPGIRAIAQEHEPIEHEVSVSRMLIPFFALDRKGEPVYDLKKEELRLYLNGKKVEIDVFNPIKFAYQKETLQKMKESQGDAPDTVIRERIVFLIIDTMYNSFYGLKNAKKIAREFVENESLEEQFVVMQNSLFGMLKLMGGPEKDKEKVKQYIKKISVLPDRNPPPDSFDMSQRNIRKPYTDPFLMVRREERKLAKEQIKFFIDFLSRLKYTLQAIDKPKTIILISEGIPEILLFENNPYLKHNVNYDPEPFRQIKRLVGEINEGGSVIYAVYPGRDKIYKEKFDLLEFGKGVPDLSDREYTMDHIDLPIARQSGMESLKALSVGSGGRVFEGHAEQVVKKIRKTTSAYYEVAFSPDPGLGDRMRIKIKCKRKGVKISSLVQTTRNKRYLDMDKVQKRVFAMNLVMGRRWAGMMANLKKAGYRWHSSGKKAIEVKIPAIMKGRAADIFLIRFEKGFRNFEISMVSKKVTDPEIIGIKEETAGRPLYFLIIEPESVDCLYDIVK